MENTEASKFTEHISKSTGVTNRVIRISYTDPYATDSSSEGEMSIKRGKGKKFVKEITIKREKKFVREFTISSNSGEGVNARRKRVPQLIKNLNERRRGVRNLRNGKFGARIRHWLKGEIWLGTYNTTEEAAMAYDNKARELYGDHAVTNFTIPSTVTTLVKNH